MNSMNTRHWVSRLLKGNSGAAGAIAGGIATLMVSLFATPSYAATLTPVDLELWLSVDAHEGCPTDDLFKSYRNSFVHAFRQTEVQDLIASSTNGIAVAYSYWTDIPSQGPVIDWALLKTAQDANNFADAIAATTWPDYRYTSSWLSDALDFSVNEIFSNNFEGGKKVITVADRDGNPYSYVRDSRDAAAARGITINGLTDGGRGNVFRLRGGPITADGFIAAGEDFETDIGDSIYSPGLKAAATYTLARQIREGITVRSGPLTPITSTPEPLSVFALGLVGSSLVVLRRAKV